MKIAPLRSTLKCESRYVTLRYRAPLRYAWNHNV